MLSIAALALTVSLAPPVMLDSRSVPGIGAVELATAGGPHLTLTIRDASGSTSTRTLDLEVLSPDAVVVEAHASSFIATEGIVIGLAAQTGDTTSYHSLFIHKLADEPGNARTNEPTPVEGRAHWWLTKPIFTSTGDRYRIIDVHNPGGDSIEITFRRGFVEVRGTDAPRIDEKLYVNICPGRTDPMTAGALLDISAARAAR